ncbi:MAG: beta-ketoacyl-ACP synthase II [Polyangiales bacterium]
MSASCEVVVTGLGLVTPLGLDLERTWSALCEGRSGVATITRFDASAHRTRIAAEVKGFDPLQWVDPRRVRETDRFTQFALAAAQMAWQDAGLAGEDLGDRGGVIIGSGMGGLETIESHHDTLRARGPAKISPYFIPAAIANLGAGQVAMRLGLRGPNYCITSACASGAHAIGEAGRWIARGAVDVMIAGGAEATITPLAIAGFDAMRALSTRNDEPERASRPFDAGRDGFVMGEGAGVLVLERRDRAEARGATIYARLAGYGATDDAHHITQPAPQGAGAQRAMRAALAEGGVSPEAVGYVNAHGTSTPAGDVQEAEAIRAVFGAHAGELAVSSTKSMTGHLLGAAGGVEAAFTALALARGVLPPTINLDAPDPRCDLDFVPHVARRRRVEHALSNAFGFGGTNVSLLLSRVGA